MGSHLRRQLVANQFHANVYLWVTLTPQRYAPLCHFIDPSELGALRGHPIMKAELCDGSHLSIQESIPQEKLLTLEEAILL